MSALGVKVRKLRRGLEMSQKKLAKKVGISRFSMILLEQGKFKPKGDKLIKLKKELGVERLPSI